MLSHMARNFFEVQKYFKLQKYLNTGVDFERFNNYKTFLYFKGDETSYRNLLFLLFYVCARASEASVQVFLYLKGDETSYSSWIASIIFSLPYYGSRCVNIMKLSRRIQSLSKFHLSKFDLSLLKKR